ncbi:MAG: EAL domain-containing protein, partial [Lachnospiraceae bacterium]|nr:EAL domain-containing protein [Lachnospiraceae bacterium]
GISPEWINLEITETAANRNWDIMLDNMHRLIDKGVTFSLDDFGTGRSNVDYFVNMPVKTVKFDNSFTQGFFSNDRMKPVLTGMADIVHKLDMSIVAEGIETEEQARAMKEMGVEYIQGFYYSRPLPKDELIKFLSKNN